jgi:hypothetical protein
VLRLPSPPALASAREPRPGQRLDLSKLAAQDSYCEMLMKHCKNARFGPSYPIALHVCSPN